MKVRRIAGLPLLALVVGMLLAVTSVPDVVWQRPDFLKTAADLLAAASPLRFEANRGQVDERVGFVARADRYLAMLSPGELVLRAHGLSSDIRVTFPGSIPPGELIGREPLPTSSHYFVGRDPTRWKTGVPNFARVEQEQLYPGITLGYSGEGRDLELDWVVAPGADPSQIELQFAGIDALRVEDDGALLLTRGDVRLRFRKPQLYQDGFTGRREVAGRYRQGSGQRVSFEIGDYDTRSPLVIDPILSYSSYLGGDDLDFGHAVALDHAGAVYIAGQSLSTDFAGHDFPRSDAMVAYVAKLNAAGNTLEYVTFIGGTNLPQSEDLLFDMMSIAVDSTGHVYLIGDTAAPDFPTVNALQPQKRGTHDAFVVKLTPDGSSLVYSTYLGGSGDDWGRRLAVDPAGNLVIAGTTASEDFPVASALQPRLHGRKDAFLAKLDRTGSRLLFSTFLGGFDGSEATAVGDLGYGMALDAAGNAYVCGYTSSPDFPTKDAHSAQISGGQHDAFVTKVAADGSAVIYSTFLGGEGNEECLDLTVDANGAAYATGWTESVSFPGVASPGSSRGQLDAFVSKVAPDGRSLVYSTLLAGTGSEFGAGIRVNSRGEAVVIGATESLDFPVTSPLQPSFVGGANDAFVSVLNARGDELVSSTFFGGSGAENHLVTSMGIALTRWGDAVVAGTTSSWDFPTVQPMDGSFGVPDISGGSVDAFVARISYGPQVWLAPEAADKRTLVLHISHGGSTPRTVRLGLWIGFVGFGSVPLHPSGGVVATMPPHASASGPIALPSPWLPAIYEIRTRLMDAETGAVISESVCTGWLAPSWTCTR